MQVSSRWFGDEQRILLTSFETECSLADYLNAVSEHRAQMAAFSHTVHLIYLFNVIPRFPRAGVTTLSRVASYVAPNEGLHFLVGQHRFFRSISSVMQSVTPAQHALFEQRIHISKTIGDALTSIRDFEQRRSAAAGG